MASKTLAPSLEIKGPLFGNRGAEATIFNPRSSRTGSLRFIQQALSTNNSVIRNKKRHAYLPAKQGGKIYD